MRKYSEKTKKEPRKAIQNVLLRIQKKMKLVVEAMDYLSFEAGGFVELAEKTQVLLSSVNLF